MITDDAFQVAPAPGVAPVLNWGPLAPVDWSGLPPLGDSMAELHRFAKKWREEAPASRRGRAPPLPLVDRHDKSREELRKWRKATGLPIETLADWRGITRSAEQVMAEWYMMAEKACQQSNRAKSSLMLNIRVGRAFTPKTDPTRFPYAELERAADYRGRIVARRTPWRIGDRAPAFPGLGDADWQWLAKRYPQDRWQALLADPFTRWHLGNRAAWAYDVESVRIRPSQMGEHPAPRYSFDLYRRWVAEHPGAIDKAIDTPEDYLILEERLRLEEAFEAHG